jgi:Holliday junction resolvase RusA-like endonuclease
MSVCVLDMTVVGIPGPQGSKTSYGPGRRMVESSKKVKPWREAVRSTAVELWAGRPRLDTPIWADMVFTAVRPKSHYRTGRNAHLLRDDAPLFPIAKPDASKLIRSTEDALTDANVWCGDERVVDIRGRKVYASEHPDALLTTSGARIRVWIGGDPWTT